ncbi:MAG TPA: PilZ domain-containing protein [Terriglobales bacterium]|nr:PilZ domain-containing protein [Terriglobales bacterium]
MSANAKPAPDGIDKRRHPRVPVDVRMMVRVTTSAVTTRFKARSVDISESGLSCRLPEDLLDGQAVMLEFALPMVAESFKVQAVVRHRRGSRHGFEFVNLAPQYKQSILRVLDSLPTLEGETRTY